MKVMTVTPPQQYPSEERILGEAAGGDGACPGELGAECAVGEVVARQIAFQKPAAQSSTDFGALASRANDGNTDTDFKHG